MNLPLKECTLSGSEILRYRVYGSGGTRVVLIHGLASRAECWTDLVPLFPADRYTVYVLDLLGSGESAKPRGADYSIRAHALRFLTFLKLEGLSGVVPVGHSLGGAVVLLAAIEALRRGEAHLLASLVVMAGPGYLQRPPLMVEIFRLPLAGKLFVALHAPDLWVKIGLRAAYYDQALVDREHLARYAPCYRDRDAKRALVATCLQVVPPDYEEVCACYCELCLPVLLLWGRHDRIVPLPQGERLHEALPNSFLEVIEQCGHNPQEEKPKATFLVIDRFISRHLSP